jgi:hypothetical protein
MQTLRFLHLRLVNSSEAWRAVRNSSRSKKHCIFNDGAQNFRLKTYYITPAEQLKQLSELGYSDTKIYSLMDGKEIRNPDHVIDHWLYFLSKVH